MSQLVIATNKFLKEEVIAACNRTRAAIISYIDLEQEKLIIRQMNKKKFFIGPYYSREEAVAKLESEVFGFIPGSYKIIVWQEEPRLRFINEIQSIAEQASTATISLTREEFSRLLWESHDKTLSR